MLEEVEGFAEFSIATGRFGGYEVLRDKGVKKPYVWWATHRGAQPLLHNIALRVICQVTSSFVVRRIGAHLGTCTV